MVKPELNRSSRAEAVLSFVKNNLKNCREHHLLCGLSYGRPFVPTRLIDVGPVGSETARLVETKDGGVEGSHQYTALSYCWGDGVSVRTTTATLAQLKAGIPVADLPRTFRDAVELTRDLGLAYLWIDALCIVQDSASDWEAESALMGHVYTGASLSIAATSAASADGGFLRDRQPKPEFTLALPHGIVKARLDPTKSRTISNLRGEAWGKRAWTLQGKYACHGKPAGIKGANTGASKSSHPSAVVVVVAAVSRRPPQLTVTGGGPLHPARALFRPRDPVVLPERQGVRVRRARQHCPPALGCLYLADQHADRGLRLLAAARQGLLDAGADAQRRQAAGHVRHRHHHRRPDGFSVRGWPVEGKSAGRPLLVDP